MACDLSFEPFIVEQIGEGNDAVQPIGGAFPTFLLTAEPAALLDIGPELVEMPAEAVGLQAKLVVQPAQRAHRAQGQGSEGRGAQGMGHGRNPSSALGTDVHIWHTRDMPGARKERLSTDYIIPSRGGTAP